MHRPTSASLALAFVVSLAACGGGGGGPTDPGGGGGGGGGAGGGGGSSGPVIKTDPSFTADIMEVFNRRGCTESSCHGGGQGGLTMSSASTAYANLVNVTSPNSGEVRVIPGNAADSYLVKKLEGRQSVGDRMPQGGGMLDETDLTNIKNWINQGAKNN